MTFGDDRSGNGLSEGWDFGVVGGSCMGSWLEHLVDSTFRGKLKKKLRRKGEENTIQYDET